MPDIPGIRVSESELQSIFTKLRGSRCLPLAFHRKFASIRNVGNDNNSIYLEFVGQASDYLRNGCFIVNGDECHVALSIENYLLDRAWPGEPQAQYAMLCSLIGIEPLAGRLDWDVASIIVGCDLPSPGSHAFSEIEITHEGFLSFEAIISNVSSIVKEAEPEPRIKVSSSILPPISELISKCYKNRPTSDTAGAYSTGDDTFSSLRIYRPSNPKLLTVIIDTERVLEFNYQTRSLDRDSALAHAKVILSQLGVDLEAEPIAWVKHSSQDYFGELRVDTSLRTVVFRFKPSQISPSCTNIEAMFVMRNDAKI